LRLVGGLVLLCQGVSGSFGTLPLVQTVPHTVGAAAGILLMVGFWTPVAGALVAVMNAWIAWSTNDHMSAILLMSFGIALAMIGPGAWSIDARLFGRKHIEASDL